MKSVLVNSLTKKSTIAGVKDIADLDAALESECEVIFLLCGTIFNLKECVKKAKEKKKIIFIHVDLVEGFSRDSVALKFISEEIKPDGIISTKNNLLKVARSLGMLTVQRIFIIDSLSIGTAIKASQTINPDAVEIMPGIMPRITKQISSSLDVPVIAGGLISCEEEVRMALESGALGVSTSSKELWR